MIFYKEDLDVILVPSAVLILIVFIVIASCREGNDPHGTKREWLKRIMMMVDTKEGLVVISSRITETYALCGACLMIFATAWLANSSSYVFQRKLVFGNSSPSLVSIKFESLILCFLLALGFFGYSAKQFKQTLYLIGSKNKVDEARAIRAYIGGSTFFSLGIRCLLCAGPLLLWFFGPIPMFVSSVALVIFLHVAGTITSPQLHVRPEDADESHGDNSNSALNFCQIQNFTTSDLLNSLDENNVIGRGSSGKVYKVVLSNGQAIAVKKLRRGKKECEKGDVEKGWVHDDGFEAEVATLEKIRHKNIVKLWGSCTTRGYKFLIYEYMPNGSLGDLLHSSTERLLDWPTRFKIARDAAEGLCYLHHDCDPAIVHRDVKSNNILLDGDFGARLADFGVAKMVDASEKRPKSSVLKGSHGHIAQDNAYKRRAKNSNKKGDIYSFGMVILELVTGKLPDDPDCGENGLGKWVCTTLDQKNGVDHVMDPKLDSCYKEEVRKVLAIGIRCTKRPSFRRPSMKKVVKMIQEVSSEKNPKIAKKEA